MKIFINFLNVTPQQIEKEKSNVEVISKNYWDPVGNLPVDSIKENSAKVAAQYQNLLNDPEIIKKHYKNGTILSFLLGIVCYPLAIFLLFNVRIDVDFIYMLFVLPFGPYGAVVAYYRSLSKDLIKIQVAKINNWLYDPKDENTSRWKELSKYFPEIFLRKKTKKNSISDQFWGSIISNFNKQYYFHSGIYTYSAGNNKDFYSKKKNSITSKKGKKYFNNTYYTFALPKQLSSRFLLKPEKNSFLKKFSKKEINTESIEFNKMFEFSYNGSKDEKALNIVKTLSPAVQQKLVELNKEKGNFEILFAYNTVTFLFNGFLLDDMKTDLKKNTQIKQDDIDFVNKELNNMIEIFEGIGKYLD